MPRVRPFPQAVVSTSSAATSVTAAGAAAFVGATALLDAPDALSFLPPLPRKGRLAAFSRSAIGGLLLAVCCLLAGCGSSTDTMQRKLDKIANEDLQDIIKEIPEKARSMALSKPYFKVDEYQEFHGDTAIVYQAKATLVFFYLDPSLDLCQVRQYRYKTTSGIWDRYDVKLMHFPKKYYGIGPQ